MEYSQFVTSPFYELLATIIPITLLKLTNEHIVDKNRRCHGQQLSEFSLRSDLSVILSESKRRKSKDLNFKIILRLCKCSNVDQQNYVSNIVEDNFPIHLKVEFNNNTIVLPDFLPNDRAGKDGRRHAKPVDLSDYIIDNPLVLNRLVIRWTQDIKVPVKYYYAVFLMRQPSLDELVYRVIKNQLIPIKNTLSFISMQSKNKTATSSSADCTSQNIRNLIDEDDVEIIDTQLSIRLNCPLSCMRIQTPVRGNSCTHLQCFDCISFLLINYRKPTWLCPICDKVTQFQNLVVDSLFMNIINDQLCYEDITVITFLDNGNWRHKSNQPNVSTINEEQYNSINHYSNQIHLERLSKLENYQEYCDDFPSSNKPSVDKYLSELLGPIIPSHSIKSSPPLPTDPHSGFVAGDKDAALTTMPLLNAPNINDLPQLHCSKSLINSRSQPPLFNDQSLNSNSYNSANQQMPKLLSSNDHPENYLLFNQPPSFVQTKSLATDVIVLSDDDDADESCSNSVYSRCSSSGGSKTAVKRRSNSSPKQLYPAVHSSTGAVNTNQPMKYPHGSQVPSQLMKLTNGMNMDKVTLDHLLDDNPLFINDMSKSQLAPPQTKKFKATKKPVENISQNVIINLSDCNSKKNRAFDPQTNIYQESIKNINQQPPHTSNHNHHTDQHYNSDPLSSQHTKSNSHKNNSKSHLSQQNNSNPHLSKQSNSNPHLSQQNNSNLHLPQQSNSNPHLSQQLNSNLHLFQQLNSNLHLSQQSNSNPHLAQQNNSNNHLSQQLNSNPHLSQQLNSNPHLSQQNNSNLHLSQQNNSNSHLSQQNKSNSLSSLQANSKSPSSQIINSDMNLSQSIIYNPHLAQQIKSNPLSSKQINSNPHISQNINLSRQSNSNPHLSQQINPYLPPNFDLSKFINPNPHLSQQNSSNHHIAQENNFNSHISHLINSDLCLSRQVDSNPHIPKTINLPNQIDSNPHLSQQINPNPYLPPNFDLSKLINPNPHLSQQNSSNHHISQDNNLNSHISQLINSNLRLSRQVDSFPHLSKEIYPSPQQINSNNSFSPQTCSNTSHLNYPNPNQNNTIHYPNNADLSLSQSLSHKKIPQNIPNGSLPYPNMSSNPPLGLFPHSSHPVQKLQHLFSETENSTVNDKSECRPKVNPRDSLMSIMNDKKISQLYMYSPPVQNQSTNTISSSSANVNNVINNSNTNLENFIYNSRAFYS